MNSKVCMDSPDSGKVLGATLVDDTESDMNNDTDDDQQEIVEEYGN